MSRIIVLLLAAVSLFFIAAPASAKDSGKESSKTRDTASGLLVNIKDDGIIVQLDNEEMETKYAWGGEVTKQSLIKRNIFNVDRINLRFKTEGDTLKVVAVEKVPGNAQGVIVGTVVKVYDNFWVAVKPKNGGMIEGFALNWPPEKFKQSHDLIKTLKPGDLVAIKYATDFERHRIMQMDVKPAGTKK